MNMERKYLYFQPEYVSKFKCDGAKCNARCCKGWMIDIDKAAYEKYSALATAQEIISHIEFNSERNSYVVKMNEKNSCPMLTENNLCRLQKDYGEDFLSKTCASYPRHTYNFGKFFERSLTLSCPVAAELILFQKEPLEFKFVEVPEKIHSNGGKIQIGSFIMSEENLIIFFELQVAMISILQERIFTIDQRLIVLGLFLDKFQELTSDKTDKDTLMRLIAQYESEDFLMEEIAPLFPNFLPDAKPFMFFVMEFLKYAFTLESYEGKKFVELLIEVLRIELDEKSRADIVKVAANYESLADEREKFLKDYSPLLENYLVNEVFASCYPWRFDNESITKNFAVLMISYKIFELLIFATTQKNSAPKDDILKLVDLFTTQASHNKDVYKNFISLLKDVDDIFLLMNCMLRG